MTLDDIRNNADFAAIEEQQYMQEQQSGYVPQSAKVPQGGQGYNPFAPSMSRSFDSVMADRMLTVKRPAVIKSGEMWLNEAGLAEIFSLMSISKTDQDDIMDEFYRIQMMSSGELNRKIVDSRQERLLARMLIQKSRLDAVEGGNVNERGWWGTSIQKLEQTIRQPAPQRPRNFVGSLLEAFSGR